MSFKGKTYSKKAGSASAKTGNPFERMMKEQCNKPVAAKSAGIVGKWGATSFTSVRTGGENQVVAPRPKKFFKSRTENLEADGVGTVDATPVTVTAARIVQPPEKATTKKFFQKGKNKTDEAITAENSSVRPTRPVRPTEFSRSPTNSKSPSGWPPLERSPVDWSPHRPPLERSPIHPPTGSNSVVAPHTTPPRVKKSRNVDPAETYKPIEKRSKLKENQENLCEDPAPSEFDILKENSDSITTAKANERKRRVHTKSGERPPKEERRSEKRKLEGPDSESSLPPIKLKLSLKPSPDKRADTQYKVVGASREDDIQSVTSQSSIESDSASDRTDLSNGHTNTRTSVTHMVSSTSSSSIINSGSSVSPPATAFDSLFSSASTSANSRAARNRKEPVDPRSSTTDAAVGKFSTRSHEIQSNAISSVSSSTAVEVVSEETRSRTPPYSPDSPPLPPPAATRRQQQGKRTATGVGRESKSTRSTSNRNNNSTGEKVNASNSNSSSPDPEIDFPRLSTDAKETIPLKTSVKEGRSSRRIPAQSGSKFTTGKTSAATPDDQDSNDFEMDFPQRRGVANVGEVKASELEAKPAPSTYKKTIFKSRAKAAAVNEPLELGASTSNPSGTATGTGAKLLPPRVPPVSDHFVSPTGEGRDVESASATAVNSILDSGRHLKINRRKGGIAAGITEEEAEVKGESVPVALSEKMKEDDTDTDLQPLSRKLTSEAARAIFSSDEDDDVASRPVEGRDKETRTNRAPPPSNRSYSRKAKIQGKSDSTPSFRPLLNTVSEKPITVKSSIDPIEDTNTLKKDPDDEFNDFDFPTRSLRGSANADKVSKPAATSGFAGKRTIFKSRGVAQSESAASSDPPPQPAVTSSPDYPLRVNRALSRDIKPLSDERPSQAISQGPQKRSIFKSKAAAAAGGDPGRAGGTNIGAVPPKKALSLYKHNLGWGGEKEFATVKKDAEGTKTDSADLYSEDELDRDYDTEPLATESDQSFTTSKLTRVATYPSQNTGIDDQGDLVTQVKCPKSYKEYFTVIKNVKKAHEINDFGEFQEFNDDVDYIIDGLNVRHKMSLRCLTCISLASKCMKPNFRMHLRAHSVVSKFFAELKDAPKNPSLALCTSTVLFVLSQDRLNMDMDRDSLELMLNLLDTDSKIRDLEGSGLDSKELEKNKQKVIDICSEMQKKGHAASLNIELISADHLSMETLLSMTSKRAGEWFKEELRELGGLGHLSTTISDCIQYLTIKKITSWTEALIDKLKKANRILRVLENVSHENEENCTYLLSYKVDGVYFLQYLEKMFKLLDEEVQLNPTTDNSDKESVGVIIRDTLFSMIRVHINIAHDYSKQSHGSLLVGQQEGLFSRVLRCMFITPFWFVPLSKRFECLVLALTLIINLVENCQENRQSIMDSMAAQKDGGLCVKEEPRMAVEDLVQMFVDREQLAKLSEEKTDNILDCVEEEVQEVDPKEEEKKQKNEGKETLEETVQKLISKAGSHMESTLIAAYIGLVIGYLIISSEDYEYRIREYLPTRNFKSMVDILNKLLNFMKMTASGTASSTKSIKATQKIITHLEKIDAEPEPEEEEEEDDDSAMDFSFEMSKDETTLSSDRPDLTSTSYSFDDWGKC